MDSFDAAQSFAALGPAGRRVRPVWPQGGWCGDAGSAQEASVRRGWEACGVAPAGADAVASRPA